MVIVIVGPTGVGKTKMSIELAKIWNGEIINADSTQVYQGMDIATAKITEEEKENIPHHLFDMKKIEEDYTVYDYQKDCRTQIEEILKIGKTPIIVGGTGLYIKAALYDYQLEKETNVPKEYTEPTNVLYEKLLKIDPNSTIHPNNRKRVERALEYYESTGKLWSEKEKSNKMLYDAVVIGLTLERSILYEKIDARVDRMVKDGLLEEARKLYDSNIRSKAVMTPIGYKELFDYFDGNNTLENSLERIKQHSRNYAKRQYTWFRNQMDVTWIRVDLNNFEKTVEEANKIIQNRQ